MVPVGDGRRLRVGWTPPGGHWESYSILLRNGSEGLVNQTISKRSSQHIFSILGAVLVPGRLYEAEVTVHSGDLKNVALCYGRLGQQRVQPHINKRTK